MNTYDLTKILLCMMYVFISASMETVDDSVNNEPCVPNCVCESNHMSCNITVPTFIPKHITNVSLYGLNYELYAEDPPFNQSSWLNITHLEILPDITVDGIRIGTHKNLQLYQRSFASMKRLIQLRFSSRELRFMSIGAFCGLENLEILDLSDNYELKLSELITGLSSCEFTKLHTLSLRGISKATFEPPNFDTEFFNALNQTSLRYLDLSFIRNGIMNFRKFSKNFVDLKYLNLENSPELSLHFIWFSIFFLFRPKSNAYYGFENLQELNMNHARIEPPLIQDNADIPLTLSFTNFPLNLKRLLLSGSFSQSKGLNVYATEENDFFKLSMIFQPSNLVIRMSFSFKSIHTQLEYLDISDNNLGILSLNLSRNEYIKFFNISHNNLHMTDPEVLAKSVSFANLENLHASHNSIAVLAFHIFSGAPKLQHIDISYNNLVDFRVNISHLHALKLLNLSHNRILYLSSASMIMFTDFVQEYHFQNDSSNVRLSLNRNFRIDLKGNPFECSCESIDFLKWILDSSLETFLESPSLCNDDRSVIKLSTVTALEESCEVKVGMIVGLTMGGILLLIMFVLLLVALKYLKRFKRRLEIKRRIKNYQFHQTNKAQVFLSYSSRNEDFVHKYIYPELNIRLQRALNINANCVSIGDANFSPGKPLIEELIRCIEESSVVLFCVSKAFCESKWCRDEVLVAHYEHKPIVLMFLENVQPQLMPKLLQKVYLSQTRSKWTQNENGEYILTPSWHEFCASLSELIVIETEF